jgi:hypothetical protein
MNGTWGVWHCDVCGLVAMTPEAAEAHERAADHKVYWTYTHPSQIGRNRLESK